MKGKSLLLISTMLISVTTFAQKNELKAADKAAKKGDSKAVLTVLETADSVMSNATADQKAQYFFLKGNAYLDLADKKENVDNNLASAAKAFQDLLATEKESGKPKFTAQATESIIKIKNTIINDAIADTKSDRNIEGAKKLYEAYLLDKKDTIYLYYSASTYVAAKDYDNALAKYDELKKLNYSGIGTEYLATNKISGEENNFTTAADRDKAVKLGTHENPRTEKIPSKRGEIYKNMALILVEKGRTEEAKKAVAEARVANPGDSSLMLTEANLYLETKDFDTYKKIIKEVLEQNPNDAGLVYNLGVISANANNLEEAEMYYKRAMEIKPDYINAYINLAALKLEGERKLVDEMNKLGMSAKDMKRYDVLKKQREDLLKSALPYLAKAYDLEPDNKDVIKTLMSVYSALEMTAEKKALQEKTK